MTDTRFTPHRRHVLTLGFAALAAPMLATRLHAADPAATVTAHNRTPDGQTMGFAPALVAVAPGAVVGFRHADRGHDVNSFDSMRPAGTAAFGGGIGEAFDVTFDTPGTYGYFCRPHRSMGMMGLVLVGDFTANLADVRAAVDGLRAPPLKRRAQSLLQQADALAQQRKLA